MTHSSQSIERGYRIVLLVALALLCMLGLLAIGQFFYNIMALLAVCLVLTYILLFPVALVEKGIRHFSERSRRLPGIQWTQRSPEANPRMLAVIIVYFIFFMGVFVGLLKVAPILQHQLVGFGETFTGYVNEAVENVVIWSDKTLGGDAVKYFFQTDIQQIQPISPSPLPGDGHITPTEQVIIQESLKNSTVNQAMAWINKGMNAVSSHLLEVATGTVNGLLYCLAGILLVFYFLLDGARLSADVIQIMPQSARKVTSDLLFSSHQVMYAFVRGQVLLGMVTGTYMFLVYTAFGVPYAILLGAFMAMAECLPVVGTWIGLAPAIVVMLFTFGPTKTAFVWLFSYSYQTIKDNIIAPKVVGDVMGLHPLVVILSLLVFAQLAGLLGVLMALPIASVLIVVIRQIQRWERGETS